MYTALAQVETAVCVKVRVLADTRQLPGSSPEDRAALTPERRGRVSLTTALVCDDDSEIAEGEILDFHTSNVMDMGMFHRLSVIKSLITTTRVVISSHLHDATGEVLLQIQNSHSTESRSTS